MQSFSLVTRRVRRAARARLGGERWPARAVVSVTEACNLRCRWCTDWRRPDPSTFALPEFGKLVMDLGEIGVSHLGLTGGEPTLLRDLSERVQCGKDHVPVVHLVTNGWLVDAPLARQLGRTGVDEIAVGIDGPPEPHDRLRGEAGAHARAVRAIRLLQDHAPRTRVRIVTGDPASVAPLAADLGVDLRPRPGAGPTPLFDDPPAPGDPVWIDHRFVRPAPDGAATLHQGDIRAALRSAGWQAAVR